MKNIQVDDDKCLNNTFRLYKILFIFLVLLLISLQNTLAQFKGFYFNTYYSPTTYNSSEQINAIAQDKKGRLIFATADGISIYNGKSWKNIRLSQYSEGKSLCVSPEGRVYIGGFRQFGYLKEGKYGSFEYISLSDSLKPDDVSSEVYTIHVLGDAVYFQSFTHIYKYQQGKIKYWHSNLRNDAYQMAFSVHNRYFVKFREAPLYEMLGDSLHMVPGSKLLVNERIYAMESVSDKTIVLGLQDNGLMLMHTDSDSIEFEKIDTPLDTLFSKHQIYRGLRFQNGQIAMSTRSGGIAVFDSLLHFSYLIDQENGLKNLDIKSMLLDNDNQLWLGTSKGIYKIDIMSPWRYWNENNGLDGAVNQIMWHKNMIYAGTNQSTLYLKDIYFQPLSEIKGRTYDFKKVKRKVDRDSILLIGNKSGLYTLAKNDLSQAELVTKSRTLYKFHHIEVKKDYLLKAIASKIEIVNTNTNWSEVQSFSNIDGHVIDIFELKNGDIWLITEEHFLYRLEYFPGESMPYKVINYTNKLPEKTEKLSVIAINDTLYVKPYKTWYCFDNSSNTFKPKSPYFAKYVLPEFPIVDVMKISENKLFISYQKNNAVEAAWLDMNANTIDTAIFSRLPKLKNISFYSYQEDSLWLTTNEGLFLLNLSNQNKMPSNYQVLLEDILVNDHTGIDSFYRPDIKKYNFPYSYNSILFNYAATSFVDESNNLFSTILIGYTNNWSEWSTQNFKEYTNLNEGTYQFKVRCTDANGVIVESDAFYFEIKAPWYRTYWAIIGYIILLAVFIYAVVKIYSIRLKEKNIHLEKIVAQRTEELQRKNSELFQQKEEISTQADELMRLSDNLIEQNGVLNSQFEEINAQKDEIVNQKQIIELQNKEVISSINYAKTIQNAILPSHKVLDSFFDPFIIYLPKDIISGDFYWFSAKKIGKENEKIFFAVVDCTGHGVPGAILSMIGSKILDEIVFRRKEYSPKEILLQLDTEVVSTLNQEANTNADGMDLGLLLFENGESKGSYSITFSGAKNDIYIAAKDKPIFTLKGDRNNIGGIKRKKQEFTNHKITLHKDDILYLTTDGYTDQCNFDRKNYGKQRLIGFLETIRHLDMETQKIKMEEELKIFMANTNQRDDITLVGLKLK